MLTPFKREFKCDLKQLFLYGHFFKYEPHDDILLAAADAVVF